MPDLTPPLDTARDHVRGEAAAPVTLLVAGDYECPYTRLAYGSVQRLERRLPLRLAFRHPPLTEIHPHAVGASAAAEAAAAQGRFWPMHDLLFHRGAALTEPDLRTYAAEIGLDLARYDREVAGAEGTEKVLADLRSGLESEVRGTPTLFVDGALYAGSYEPEPLQAALAR